jgi:hypothetical protein
MVLSSPSSLKKQRPSKPSQLSLVSLVNEITLEDPKQVEMEKKREAIRDKYKKMEETELLEVE